MSNWTKDELERLKKQRDEAIPIMVECFECNPSGTPHLTESHKSIFARGCYTNDLREADPLAEIEQLHKRWEELKLWLSTYASFPDDNIPVRKIQYQMWLLEFNPTDSARWDKFKKTCNQGDSYEPRSGDGAHVV